ncbi:flagellar basal body-associated protein FliL [uncultured Sphingomonas sp.]|uniref:flagellar basal body-associated FliL family protein n=1 Tax=uncultured Sphingomonas sp. TaxID=158754 RepID=UPI0035CC2372
MADKKDDDAAPPAKKKGGLVKMLVMVVGLLVLVGGGVGAGLYAASSGLIGGGHKKKVDDGPQLVPKSQQKAPAAAEGGGSSEGEAKVTGGKETPEGEGGDRFASNYYPLDKDFTANLQDSAHFIQVGLAISTPYDEKEIARIKTNEIAIRSAVLMALGDTTEDQVFTSQGKRQLQARLTKAINDTLSQKEGFGGVGNVYFTNFVVQ